jgi:hypothetical protein
VQKAPSIEIIRVIWLALLASQAVYIGVALIFSDAVGTGLGDNRILSVALALVSVASAALAHSLWRRASGAGLSLHEIATRQPARSVVFFIQAWAIDESIAIYGLMQALLGVPIAIWLPFSCAGALLLVLHRPVDPTA